MGMGRRKRARQEEFWIPADALPETPRHVFYEKLNGLLADGDFDPFVEGLCQPYYAEADEPGRRSIPPGVYFRMLLIGYFEGIDSQRGIAWRCADSRSLAAFLGHRADEATPDHSSLTRIRNRLPLAVHEEVFARMLSLAEKHQLLSGKTLAVDSTTLEANAAMKSIVRRDTGEDWKEFVRRLAAEEGVEIRDEKDLRRFDKKRKDKKVSNAEWQSSTDEDARIMKMKDGRTRLGYKAEHVIDLESELIVQATVHLGTEGDAETLVPSVVKGQANLIRAGSETSVKEVVADAGYHKNETLAECAAWDVRTYIPESERGERRWEDKPSEWEKAFRSNRRRVRGERGKRLGRLRSERVERSFAHVCNTGGARRTWLRGLEKINKRYLMQAAAHNLAIVMRALFGVGKPRCLQGAGALAAAILCLLQIATEWLRGALTATRVNLRAELNFTLFRPSESLAA